MMMEEVRVLIMFCRGSGTIVTQNARRLLGPTIDAKPQGTRMMAKTILQLYEHIFLVRDTCSAASNAAIFDGLVLP